MMRRCGWIAMVAGLAGGCNELPVEVRSGTDLDVSYQGQEAPLMVGMTDTLELNVVLDGMKLTGLRVRWVPFDSTALAVRSLADATKLPSTATAFDTLDATLLGELTPLKRGDHRFLVFFDSVGIEGVRVYEASVSVQERWQAVSAGYNHTCAVTFANTFEEFLDLPLRRGGEVFCWGEASYGALGTGSSDRRDVPGRVASDVTFDEVRAGYDVTCGREELGLLHCWGDNADGQLGLGNRLDQFVPRLIALGEAFRSFDVGGFHTCGVEERAPQQLGGGAPGLTFCWGANEVGELGCGATPKVCDPAGLLAPNTVDGSQVADSSGGVYLVPFFRSLSLGPRHACGVTVGRELQEEGVEAFPEGIVVCWGNNSAGELGVSDVPFSGVPVPIESGGQYADVAAGGEDGGGFTCGLDQDSLGVHCWGAMVDASTPVAVVGLPAAPLSALSAGGEHACALAVSGEAYCWGRNGLGQLGDGTTEDSPMHAVRVQGDLTFGVLDAGAVHTCAITVEALEVKAPLNVRPSGGIYCWGDNSSGQLGRGSSGGFSSVPVRVVEPGSAAAPLFRPTDSQGG